MGFALQSTQGVCMPRPRDNEQEVTLPESVIGTQVAAILKTTTTVTTVSWLPPH